MSRALGERIAIGATTLEGITDATVEIVVQVSVAPEGGATFGKQVVHQFRDRTVKALHQFPEVLTDTKETEGVIVIAEKTCDPWDVSEFGCVMLQALPEDR